MDVLQYYFLRRWLTARGQEALSAALEDIVQYEEIKAPASRSKWARAIVASMESERGCSDVLMQLTQPPSVSVAAPKVASVDGTPLPWHLIPVGTPCPAMSGPNAWTTWQVQHTWKEVKGMVAASSNTAAGLTGTSSLPDGLFNVIFSYVIKGVAMTSLPIFAGSKEFVAYKHISNCIGAHHAAHVNALNEPRISRAFDSGKVCDDDMDVENSVNGHLDAMSRSELTIADFERLGVIGSGSYGSVYVWRQKRNGG